MAEQTLKKTFLSSNVSSKVPSSQERSQVDFKALRLMTVSTVHDEKRQASPGSEESLLQGHPDAESTSTSYIIISLIDI